jgi:hypothetical protein
MLAEMPESFSQKNLSAARSRGVWNQEWLCWWGPAAIYQTDRSNSDSDSEASYIPSVVADSQWARDS